MPGSLARLHFAFMAQPKYSRRLELPLGSIAYALSLLCDNEASWRSWR